MITAAVLWQSQRSGLERLARSLGVPADVCAGAGRRELIRRICAALGVAC